MSSDNCWRAECQDCPTTLDLDYGGQIRVNHEAPDEQAAYWWLQQHRAENPDHDVTVSKFVRCTLTIEHVDTDTMRALFGAGWQQP